MTVVYIAGPFRGACAWDIEGNIRRAESLALDVWRLGAVALCPHTNSRFFHGAASDALWLAGAIELMLRCDAVLMTPDYRLSHGARTEKGVAESRGIPVFETIDALHEWLNVRAVAAHA